MSVVKPALACALVVLASLGAHAGAPLTSASVPSLRLTFVDAEKGITPYRTQMVVNRDYLRIDDATPGAGYILMDRRAQVIYSVAPGDRTILTIARQPVTGEPEQPLRLEAVAAPDPEAPAVEGRIPVHYHYTVNGKSCYDTISVPGMLDQALDALREYREILAGSHAATLQNTPPEMRDPCMLAMHIYHPVRYLEPGFPIREWDERGFRRQLVDVEKGYAAPRTLFELPQGYTRYGVGERRQGLGGARDESERR